VIIAGAGLATLWGQWFVGCGVQPSFFLMLLIVFSSSIVGGDGITYGFVSAVSSVIMIEKELIPPMPCTCTPHAAKKHRTPRAKEPRARAHGWAPAS
jgi:hypothetical protein